MIKTGYVLLFFIFIESIAAAQFVPNGMNYQCVVRNNAGVPLVGSAVKLRFAVLNGLAGDTVYAEEHFLNTNPFGLATATIGRGNVLLGQFDTIDWASGPKYLNVQTAIGSGSYISSGTSPFLTVPYAMVAKKTTDGVKYQRLLSQSSFSTTQRGQNVYAPDSLIVAESGYYLITADANGYGITYNYASNPIQDDAVYLRFYSASLLFDLPLHDYKKDNGATISYNLTPRQTSRITTLYLTAGQVIHPVVYIYNSGSGSPNTNALGYSSFELTLVKLQ